MARLDSLQVTAVTGLYSLQNSSNGLPGLHAGTSYGWAARFTGANYGWTGLHAGVNNGLTACFAGASHGWIAHPVIRMDSFQYFSNSWARLPAGAQVLLGWAPCRCPGVHGWAGLHAGA